MGVWKNDVHRLANSSEDKQAAVNIVIGAYRSIRHPIVYVSMPITTGKKFYEVLETHQVLNLEELLNKDKNILYNEVIRPNISQGIALADNIAKKVTDPVIAPSVFEAKQQRWTQDEYMFLWFRVIEERAKSMYMSDGWEYSTGGCLEFVRAMEMQFGFINPLNGMEFFPNKSKNNPETYQRMRNIKVYDSQGKEIRIDLGVKLMSFAITQLNEKGFTSNSLYAPLCKLLSIGYSGQSELFLSRAINFIKKPYTYNWQAMQKHSKQLGLVQEK